MTDTTDTPDDVPRTLAALNAKLDQVVANGGTAIAAIHRLIDKKDRSRRLTALLAALAFAASGLAIGVAYQRCEDTNVSNAKQVRLWEFVIGLSAATPSPLTPDQQAAQLKALRAFLAGTFPQRDCWPIAAVPVGGVVVVGGGWWVRRHVRGEPPALAAS